ncbi:HAD family hydrolase [Mesorhizobium sp. VNQ89]|uniref:HAD family hydrolase n=1 Tax=Mesorhizobium quangtriensis TaxID=3157709 RepID=UPI0032B859CE
MLKSARSMPSLALCVGALLVLLQAASIVGAQADPLPSWNDTNAKAAIIAFVESTTSPSLETYVTPGDRIAVFDNDGCLWAEQPVYFQFLFAIDMARKKAAADPAWASTAALKAAAAGDIKGVLAGGESALIEVVSATHSGMTVEDFTAQAAEWIATAKHPTTGRAYSDMIYQPMLELLSYLRDNDYQTWIVSGGGVDFMRAFAEPVYGIPPQQVIGSLGKADFQMVDGKPQVMKDPGIAFIDDKGGKPVGIERNIGKRPIFVAGNSDGDLAMLQWSTAGEGPRFGMIVHHTDAAREWTYDRESHIGQLSAALDQAPAAGWLVVDMAKDWATIYPEVGK